MSDDITSSNRVYQCLGCGYVGDELAALEHQTKCDNAVKEITKGGES